MNNKPLSLTPGGMYAHRNGIIYKCLTVSDPEYLGAAKVQNMDTGETSFVVDAYFCEDGRIDWLFETGFRDGSIEGAE